MRITPLHAQIGLGPNDEETASLMEAVETREIGIDASVARGIRMGQGIACNAATDAEMIELGALRAKTCFDVAQAFTIGQLRESHAQVLIEAREAFDLVLALVASNALPESGERQMLHDLSENEFRHGSSVTPAMENLAGSQMRGLKFKSRPGKNTNYRFRIKLLMPLWG